MDPPGKIVQPAEQGLVNPPQPRDGTDLDMIDVTAFIKTAGVAQASFVNVVHP
ncbi:hypothetical protein [Pyramidobacter sp. C12-8]|uniref:hypothetical protein n=1 Tax=Pyramidobacter sp. C12-8 TaxID=1943580 RepID=UPI00406CC7B5